MQKFRQWTWAAIITAAIAGGSYFGAMHFATRSASAEGDTAVKVPVSRNEGVNSAMELSKAFRTVHNALKDAVVNINTTKKITVTKGKIPDEMRKMLPHGMLPPGMDPEDLDPEGHGGIIGGTGSGVIVSADGYILTNNHVVDDADEITVSINEGGELKAKIIGRDAKTDLAVIKVDATKLAYAKLGDSDSLDVGDWVLAFGSPFGFEQTMTQGIISAKGRQVNIIGMNRPELRGLTYENFLQTDAAINPGNSGGPLVNLKGEVIGINTAIASRSGAYNGIGFSIPSNDARYIMDSLIKNGKVVRGYLGVMIGDVRDAQIRAQARKDGFTGDKGVLITGIQADSPGGKGGLKLGDVITAINAKPVETLTQLRTAVARTEPNSKITMTVFRQGKSLDLTFAVGTQPDSAIASAGEEDAPVAPGKFDSADLGLSVRELDAKTAKKYKLETGKGVLVTEVDPKGLAAEMGVQPGDVIMSIDHADVKSAKDFSAALAKTKLSEGVQLNVRAADGSERLVYIEKK